MLKTLKIVVLLIATLLYSVTATADGVYQEPGNFIKQVFEDEPPKPDVLWLTKDLKHQLSEILGHKYKGLRIRYWQKDKRSAWILEEIGKEKPITTGVAINQGHIERVKVLIFRESRGWEVRHDFFTDQFKQAKLQDDGQLDKHIDNISGATLSVRAVRKLVQIALLLDRTVAQDK